MKQIGLIGFPLEHSFSQRYFTEKFEREAIENIRYENFPIESVNRFPELLNNHPNLVGLNVTIPYKSAIIPHLDELDEHASQIGAVNTIRIENGRSIGYNTDWLGFKNSLTPHLSSHIDRALLLGSGGAAKGVGYALQNMGIHAQVVSRNPAEDEWVYDKIEAATLNEFPLIVNCTPLGTYPNNEGLPQLPYDALDSNHLLFDLVYNPPITAFMQQGLDAGARAINGYEMLVYQAEAAWEIWNA